MIKNIEIFFSILLAFNQIILVFALKQKLISVRKRCFIPYHITIQVWIILSFLKSLEILSSSFAFYLCVSFILLFFIIILVIVLIQRASVLLGFMRGLFLTTLLFFLWHLTPNFEKLVIYGFFPFLLIEFFMFKSYFLQESYADQMEFLTLRSILMGNQNISNFDIYQWIGEDLEYLFPNTITIVCKTHEKNAYFIPKWIGGVKNQNSFNHLLLNNLIGKVFHVPEVENQKTKKESTLYNLKSGILEAFYGQISLKEGKIIEQQFGISKGYQLYFHQQQQYFAQALIFPIQKKNQPLPLPSALQIYARLISISFYQIETFKNLEESEKRFRELTEFLPETIFEIDPQGSVLYANETAKNLTGYTNQDLQNGLSLFDLLANHNDIQRVKDNIYQHIQNIEIEPQEYEVITKHKEKKILKIHVRPISTYQRKDKPTFQGIAIDITKQKKIEKAMELQAQALVKSNTELQQFAHIASHDLKEPLRMVSSYLTLLKNRYQAQLNNDAQEFIDFAVEGALRMQKLIDGLLSYSRIHTQAENLQKVDLNIVLTQVVKNLELKIKEQQGEITIPSLPIITANETQMIQLFQNLFENALKFSKPHEPPKITLEVQKKEKEWEFRFCDNGIGIPEKSKDHVFKIFTRAHSKTQYHGTGLGLALCKRIIDYHKGQIDVQSTENIGSCFYFTLPC